MSRNEFNINRMVLMVPALIFLLHFMRGGLLPPESSANRPDGRVKYQTHFGKCPSRSSGNLTMSLVNEYGDSRSLKSLKETIKRDRLEEKYFLEDFKIMYDVVEGELNFHLDCPKPLMKAQVYQAEGDSSYDALLVDNGKLFDPTYEVILRSEEKLKNPLPFLSISDNRIKSPQLHLITNLYKGLDDNFKKYFSEVILGSDDKLTIILSLFGRPTSVFMGDIEWPKKLKKLQKTIHFLRAKNKIPAIINLTNSKKVVVKFSDQF